MESKNSSQRLMPHERNTRGTPTRMLLLHVLMCSREYLPELERARAARDKSLQDMKDESMAHFVKDLTVDKQRNPALGAAWEEDENVDEDGEDNIIDRCELPSRISKPAALVYGTLI